MSVAVPLVEVRDLTKTHPGNAFTGSHRRPAVDGVSFEIAAGETLGLVGESGSGKTTVARLILRLLEPTSGSVLFAGKDVLKISARELMRLRREMQIVFQDPYAAMNPRMNIFDIVSEPMVIHDRQISYPERQKRAQEMLGAVGMDASALRRFPHEFSGGQRQRINLARALVLRPKFLILDEPVSALDVSVGAQIINLLRDLQREFGLTYLFISHSMPLVRYLADRIAVMQGGKLVEIGDALEVCERPREFYTRELIAATPEMR